MELSDSKLSNNNLASELVENKTFLNQSQARKLQFLWLARLCSLRTRSQLQTPDTRNSWLHVSHSSHALSYNR